METDHGRDRAVLVRAVLDLVALMTFWDFCAERERIRVRRESRTPGPLTEDPRLARYWFPNIRRMDDPTTVWLHGALLRRLADPEQLIMATVAFRLFGSRAAGEQLVPMFLCSKYNEAEFLDSVGPLIRPFNGRLHRHLRSRSLEAAARTLAHLQRQGACWHLLRGATLREATRALSGVVGIGPELAYEMVCDLRWTPVLQGAPDAYSWALPGRSAVEAAGGLVKRDLRSTRQADRARAIDLMRGLLADAQPAWCWEMSEPQRALTLFHFWCRERRPSRRYRPCN